MDLSADDGDYLTALVAGLSEFAQTLGDLVRGDQQRWADADHGSVEATLTEEHALIA